jgi:hypothetical protein
MPQAHSPLTARPTLSAHEDARRGHVAHQYNRDMRQICFRPSPIRVQKVNIDVTSSSTLNQDLSLVFDLQLARSRNLERWQRLFAIRSSRAALTFIVDHPIPLQIRPHHSRWVSKVSQPASLLVVRPLTHASRLDRSAERACSTSDEGP